MKSEVIIKKTIFNIIVYVLYYNAVFYFLMPEIYENTIYIIYLAILYGAGIIDTYIRPLNTKDEEENYAKFIALLFLINPVLLVLGVLEHDLLFGDLIPFLSIIGLVIYAIASGILLLSRIQLGKQATGRLIIVEDHELITTGMYQYVRHPMYSGTLLGIVGFALVVQSIIVPGVSLALYFWVFNNRAIHEEKILFDQFGEEYQQYQKLTHRFVPYIW